MKYVTSRTLNERPCLCHPELPHAARGLCQPCYRAWKAGEFPFAGLYPEQWRASVGPAMRARVTSARLTQDKPLERLLARACRPLRTTYEPWVKLAAYLDAGLREVVPGRVLALWIAIAREDVRCHRATLLLPAPTPAEFTKTKTLQWQLERAQGAVVTADRILHNARERLLQAQQALQAAEARQASAQAAVMALETDIGARLTAAEAAMQPALDAHAAAQTAAAEGLQEALAALATLGATEVGATPDTPGAFSEIDMAGDETP